MKRRIKYDLGLDLDIEKFDQGQNLETSIKEN